MNNEHVEQLTQRYARDHAAKITPIKEGRWTLTIDQTKVTVHHFGQKSRWEGLTTLAINIDFGDEVENLKYHYAWISYPQNDQVGYDSFAYAINQLLKRYAEDLEFQRLLHPSSAASTGS